MTKTRLIMSSLILGAGMSVAACQTVGDVVGKGMTATLTGSEQVPALGDPDGRGMVEIATIGRASRLCYELSVSNIDTATAAHIHRGARGVVGPPVIALDPPAGGGSNGCLRVDPALLREIEGNPRGFYVNVHNAAYPNGAVRGQLVR
jgi:hypothetical protein